MVTKINVDILLRHNVDRSQYLDDQLMKKIASLIVAAFGLQAGAPPAWAATYSLKPFTIRGATSVSAIAINDRGVAVGICGSPSSGYSGFQGSLGAVTNLPALGSGASIPIPSAVNDAGTVVGSYYSGSNLYGFVWQNGSYTNFFSEGLTGAYAFPPNVASNGLITFNYYQGGGAFETYAGPQSNPANLNIGDFAIAASVNSAFDIAGEYEPFRGNSTTTAVFLATTRNVKTILPPGALASFGGFLNDQGAIAGTFRDAASQLHGFLYTGQAYIVFDTPTKPSAISVHGVDNVGRVVGVFSDYKGQHAFLYYSNATTSIGNWAPSDNVHVAISRGGKHIAISVTPTGSTISTSYLARCNGAGC